MNYTFCHIDANDVDWKTIEQSTDANCFFSRQWCNYLSAIGRKIFIVAIHQDNKQIGYFIGVKRRIGISTIGAPPDATGTFSQGLCMIDDTSVKERITIYQSLWEWISSNHYASYMQVCDWQIKGDSEESLMLPTGIHYQPRATLVVDTRQSEEQLWAALHYKSCKYSINKARKLGLKVHRIIREEDIPAFVDMHYSHLLDVCHRKGMEPQPYQSKSNMMELCKRLFPDKVIMLQVVGPDDEDNEQVMSSAIFCPGKTASTYFTGASFQQYMKYCPNEMMVWEGMRLLHEQGAGDLIFGGTAHYKTKFGTSYKYLPMLIFSKYRTLYNIRLLIKKSYSKLRETIAKIKTNR